MKLDILDYSPYGNKADMESDVLFKGAAEALGYRTRVIPLIRGKAIPEPEKRVWLRYDLRSRRDLAWITRLAGNLETDGHLVFPRSLSILMSEDKWETHLALQAADIPSVATFRPGKAPKSRAKAILKPRVGWGGIGIKVLENTDGSFPLPPGRPEHFIWQPFVPHRQTWTVAVAGESPVATLEKRATGKDFRTNADFGESAAHIAGPNDGAALAARALTAVGLVTGTVDIIEVEGRLTVLEVNSAPCVWYDNLPALDLAGPMVRSVMEWMDRCDANSHMYTP
ncbi:MAG: hypothetical protein C0392_04605 [Syntrophus sp. (in: bacteria)]|nr:hypothetical protein [Syntrophus sp. (in: bacteria)]